MVLKKINKKIKTHTRLGAADDGLNTHIYPKVLMTPFHAESWEQSHIMADVWLEPTLRHCLQGIWQHPESNNRQEKWINPEQVYLLKHAAYS